MSLYTVHLHLIVRLARLGHRSYNKAVRMRMVVCADSVNAAEKRARGWFERASTGPLMRVTFGNGLWDATEVRLAESDKCPSIEVFDQNSDIMEWS